MQFARTDSLSESPNLPLSKLTLKNELKAFCDIYTEGPICLGNGSRVISKALNMDGIVGDFVFTQKIVQFCY